MYVRIAHWSCDPDHWNADADLFENGAVPILRKYHGFVRAMLLGEDSGARRIALTVWESADAYRAFVASPDLERITAMFAHMYVDGKRPGPVHEYVVRAQGAN
ncbi:MAG: antibiotic biosynthesis monooxygenase [Paracoccaceae bacterium]|nr:antibiotic biosynthesis monooxygenase [Paracoccaceae bacterium]